MLPPWTQNTIPVNDAQIHYYRTGDSTKPPLVLAHGFSDNGLCWLLTARDLEAQYDVILPDAQGHGLSERVRPGVPVDMASDLAGLIRGLGLDRPIVGGHSMGAMVAYQLSVRYPDLVRALVLEDPPWWLPEQMSMRPVDQHTEHPMAPWVRTCTTSTLEELMAQARVEHPTWPEIAVQTWCAAKKRLDPNILSILRVDGSTWQTTLASLACPVLVFTADPVMGGIVTPELAARACELNPRITIAHIAGVGHHIRFADYETYMQTFRKFLDTIHIGLG